MAVSSNVSLNGCLNDNFGRWRSDLNSQVQHCLEIDAPRGPVVKLLLPDEQDYFVPTPKHTGFFSTSLDILLKYLKAKRLIPTGFAGTHCVLYTANDACMRDDEIIVPRDCMASEMKAANETALKPMQKPLKAEIRDSAHVHFKVSPIPPADELHERS